MKSFSKATLILMAIILLFSACQGSTTVSKGLSVEETLLAVKDGDAWAPVDDAKFKKGDIIGLIMLNVSGFKKGEDGLNWMEMDVQVTGPDEEVVLDAKGLFGENGHINMENNTAKSPVGFFETNSSLASGQYVMKVTLYDKVGEGVTTNTKSLTLED